MTTAVGQQVRAYRRRRGMSQAALAARVGRSESWLSQVERGVRGVDRLSVLNQLATALDVDPDQLTGEPWTATGGDADRPRTELDQLRRALARYDALLEIPPGRAAALPAFRLAVDSAHRHYQGARYALALAQLPQLVTDADTVARLGTPDAERAVTGAYVAAAKLMTKLGEADLAQLTADRAAAAAVRSDDAAARALAAYQLCCALLRAGRVGDAERLGGTAAEAATSRARRRGTPNTELLSAVGALWLITAVIAGRRGDRTAAWAHLEAAQQLADILGADGNSGWTAFGPTNVALHRVSVAVELGDAGEALRLAGHVSPDKLPAELHSRRAQIHLDLAWAQAARRRDAEAVLHLLDAERVAPEATRYNVAARELIRDVLGRQGRRAIGPLTDLALRAGVVA